MDATIVLFPSGATSATGRVLATARIGERWAVVTDVTPFHPIDHAWPDQPADRGTLNGAPVSDCLTGAVGPDSVLRLGADIPARRGDADWTWVVVHLMETEPPAVGDAVPLLVDADYRAALSRAHTACHLAALGLNRATAGLWRRQAPRVDSLGNPDLDALAIERSRITPDQSEDGYRLGKSIRKKGLDTESLLAGLPDLAATVTRDLREWIATAAEVRIDTGGDSGIAARRTWHCALPDGDASYPCGGTHASSLAELPSSAHVEYWATDTGFKSRVSV